MAFEQPWAWLLLLALPLLWWQGRGRLRGPRRWLGWGALALRGTFLVLLVAALAQPTLRLAERRTHWLFLVDRSDSMTPAAREQAGALLEAAREQKAPGDRLAVMGFGAGTAMEAPFEDEGGGDPDAATVDGSGTHLERALGAALAAFPAGGRRRMVLLSDGNQTRGDARDAVVALRSRDVPVYAAAPAPGTTGEVLIEDLVLPAAVRRGDTFTLEVVVRSTGAGEAVLALSRDGEPLGEYRVELAPGRNLLPLELTARDEGHRLFRATVRSGADRHRANNRLARFLRVRESARVLLVHGERAHSAPLIEALASQGVRVNAVPAAQVPRGLPELLDHDTIVFDNAPGVTLSRSQMEHLAAYVRDHGGGFLMVGGEQSFAGGGYQDTPVETLLPVDMETRHRKPVPAVALVLVLDRSDSMGNEVNAEGSAATKLEVAKLAALASTKLLEARDRVGLVAFDVEAKWAVPITRAGNREAIARRIDAMTSGGGTDLYAGLEEATNRLRGVRAYRKHIIALSDGLTPAREFEALLKNAAADRITVSTVGLGAEADQDLLRKLSRWGAGRFYATDDPLNIPRIFTAETRIVARRLVQERPFRPALTRRHPVLEDVPLDAMPPLGGYARTSPKPAAEVVLSAPQDDPLLAVRRYGLGRSAAFTADFSTAWGREWVRWEAYPRVVTQIVRWLARRDDPGNLEVGVEAGPDTARVMADLVAGDGGFLNGFAVQAELTRPEGGPRTLALHQVAPGRYQAEFPLERGGSYRIAVTGRRGDRAVGPRTLGLTVPYAPEYRHLAPDTALLGELAEGTGGRLLDANRPAEALAGIMAGQPPEPVQQPIWPYLLAAGLLVFLADIALRQFAGAAPEPAPAPREGQRPPTAA